MITETNLKGWICLKEGTHRWFFRPWGRRRAGHEVGYLFVITVEDLNVIWFLIIFSHSKI